MDAVRARFFTRALDETAALRHEKAMRSVHLGLIVVAFAVGCGSRTEPLCETCGASGASDAASDDRIDGGGDASFTDGSGSDGVTLDGSGGDGSVVDAIGLDVPTPPLGCPATLPEDGTPCGASLLDCPYFGCNPAAADHATCEAGRWRVRASACSSVCPTTIPENGAPCTLPLDVDCTWSSRCAADFTGACSGSGRWIVKGGCDAGCPVDRPTIGAACDGKLGCAYFNDCGQQELLACVGGAWTLERSRACSAPAPCPASAPTAGTTCTTGLACGYANACGSVDAFECDGGAWIEFVGRCADPLCPTTPSQGDACTDEGHACTYPLGGGCTFDCTCTRGAYVCVQTCARE